MNDVLQLDFQKISGKLKPLIDVPVSKESMISDSYDLNTKNFLSFIIETIETAKNNKEVSTETVIYKINQLVKDANKLLSDYFEKNSLKSYYEDVLSTTLNNLSDSLNKTGESLNVETIKTSIINVLKELNSTNENERKKQFEQSLSSFKEEFSETFSKEISSKTTEIQKNVENKVKTEIEQKKDNISKEINKSTQLLLYKTVPEYMKSLDKVFSENFKQYIESNFTNKAKQLSIANKFRKVFNNILLPFALTAKIVKSAKNGLLSIGHKVKTKLSEKLLGPISSWKNKIKTRVNEKLHKMKVGFLEKTRFLRRPKKAIGMWFAKTKKKLEENDTISTLKKFGLLGLMIKGIINLINRTKKNYKLLSQMDFKPFKFLSVASNSVDEFIESVSSHTTIILSNLKLYFDQNVVEGYDVRKKLGFLGKLKEKVKKAGKIIGGFNLLAFFTSLPGLINTFKRIWNIIKKIYKFIKNSFKFIWKVSKSLIKGIARFIGKSLVKLGTKLGWKGAVNVGEKMASWGARGIGRAGGKAVGKTAGKGGIKGLFNGLRNLPKTISNLKSVQKARGIVKALKPSNIAAAIKGSKLLAKGGIKAAAKAAGKAAGKAASKVAGKLVPSPLGTITAFAMDAAFAAMEAQDTDAMAKLYGIEASEVGAQQRGAYIVAGTLIGGTSPLDVDWNDKAALGMAALDTGMTMMKWAGVGAMIGSVVPGLGTGIGAAIGAGLGLVFSLIGTQRLAKAINWICNTAKAVWNFVTNIPILGAVIGFAGKVIWAHAKFLYKSIVWLGKALWGTVKFIGKSLAWLGKMSWKAIKGIGKGIAWLGKMSWKGIKNLWRGTKNLVKKLDAAIAKFGKKVFNLFSSIKTKIANKIKEFANRFKNVLLSIGNKLKDSILRIGKSLLSTIFPYSPLVLAGKALRSIFRGLKNFFFGESDLQIELDEIKTQLKNVNSVASNSYTNVLQKKLQNHIILESVPNEGNDVSQTAKTDIFDISKLTDMVDQLLDVPPEVIPVPQQVEEKEDTQATKAAEHWEEQQSVEA